VTPTPTPTPVVPPVLPTETPATAPMPTTDTPQVRPKHPHPPIKKPLPPPPADDLDSPR